MIVNDALTKKSFEEVHEAIANYHYTSYLKARGEYDAAIDFYCKSSNVDPDSITKFSPLDSPGGFNESPAPHSSYIINVFEGVYYYH